MGSESMGSRAWGQVFQHRTFTFSALDVVNENPGWTVGIQVDTQGFEEAQSVFFDERARLIDDPDHSEDEERFILLGLSSTLRVLVVVHCYRSEGNAIRIISARRATQEEQRHYP